MVQNVLPPVIGIVVIAAAALATGTASAPSAQPASDITIIGEAIVASPAAAAALSPMAAAAPPPGCADAAYTFAPWHLGTTYRWAYNAAGAPASVAAQALATIHTASQTVASGRNRCGLATGLRTTQQYIGATNKVAQVNAAGACTGNDGTSVTSWGSLPASYLAYTCAYYRTRTGVLLSSDLLIDGKVHKWGLTVPANCTSTFDLESVVVHERGHTAGLAHVDQTAHATQVMSPRNPPCTTIKRTLAAGDLAGLQRLY
ncbi:MAG: matrixin family metalloprotease [Actinophytocola sp.]|uniref:matrixin family metalloprotease n=1 Tax=Actinophytocola sp. TaxID=1872138 RepID=UPI003C70AD85